MIVDSYIVDINNINVMCIVNIRGHEANFYEAEARKSDAEWFGLEALTSLQGELNRGKWHIDYVLH